MLVNNAANDDRHKFEDVTPEYWDQRIAVNLKHLFFGAQAVAAGMKRAGGGSIINLGSVSWHLALPCLPIYETAKAGIEGLSRSLARDLGEAKIRVNTVVPGAIRTAAPDEALAYAGGRSQDPCPAMHQGARRSRTCDGDGPVPGIR